MHLKMTAIQFLLVLLCCDLAKSQLPTFGSCRIEADAGNNVGTSTHSRDSQPMTVYSCVANDNCNYDVHVVGCSESYNHGYSHRIRNTDVSVNVQGQSSKPLILVLLSYEPINWILSIPTDVLIDTVIVGGFYVIRSEVSFTPGRVLAVEKPSRAILPYAYGSESSNTIKVLQYVANRFGPVASFTGTYRATSWRLNIHRRSADLGCVSVTPPPTVSTPLFTSTVAPASCTEPSSPQGTSSCSGGRQCVRNIFNYLICSGKQEEATCVSGYCRCPNSLIREPCNCYPSLGGCLVQKGSSNAVGTPYNDYRWSSHSPTTYSCVTDCTGAQYEVHVIGMYSRTYSFLNQNTTVEMTVCGESSKPLVLVLTSYEALNWTVNVPNGITIEKILVSSYYTDRTNVSHTPRRVGTVEKVGYGYLPYGYGRDVSSGSTAESLQYLINRFGAIASFSGAYSADRWVLDIQRDSGSLDSCVTSVTATTDPPTTVPPTTGFTTASSTCFHGLRCGSRCIPRYQVCDRIRHCSDGSDERGCGYARPSRPPRPSTPSSSSSNLGIILGTIFGILGFICTLGIILLKCWLRSNCPSSNVPPRVQQPSTTYSYSLQQPSTVNSNSDPTSTFTGVPHSTVPLESELQNAPPPAYSTAHQYPLYTQPDEATSQNKSTPHGEEPTAEAPPSYDDGHIQEPPPPYPGPPQ